jgi:DnaJ-domain-containing protein 1
MVMEVAAAQQDKSGEDEERWALQGIAKVNPALGTSCLGPVGLET